ncbi:MAG: sigma-70 family RNA polymerase sigma factor, partial [Gammaproteobacteria bacterium]|nr:sigma-70 family RNA polymerase sigma factor [Gammaproteobacteria bacterium]
LFQRILQNKYSRLVSAQQKYAQRGQHYFSSFRSKDSDDDEFDILESLAADVDANVPTSPANQLEQSQVLKIIEEAVEMLPGRQREAFMLRYWEEFDVAETAEAMGCSQGSVKTHCSRAVFALSKSLRAKGITIQTYLKTELHQS